MRKLFIVGFPGLYGGAATELHHQIMLWSEIEEIKLFIIPTMGGYQNEPLYQKMIGMGVEVLQAMNFDAVTKDDAVINFCSSQYLDALPEIRKHTDKIMWANCMTFLFMNPDRTVYREAKDIKYYLYQRDQVRDAHRHHLKKVGSTGEFLTFVPYFDRSGWKFHIGDHETTNIGRISRSDRDKYSDKTMHIYEYIVSPKMKRGHFLGFDANTEGKTGKPHHWIKTYRNHTELSVEEFYNTIDFIIQPTDTNENWPRIGFEAMYSGRPLVVDDKGGWKFMIEHGKSGFLCKTPRDFIYWGSRLAYEPDLRREIASNALERAEYLSGFDRSMESWMSIFEKVFA